MAGRTIMLAVLALLATPGSGLSSQKAQAALAEDTVIARVGAGCPILYGSLAEGPGGVFRPDRAMEDSTFARVFQDRIRACAWDELLRGEFGDPTTEQVAALLVGLGYEELEETVARMRLKWLPAEEAFRAVLERGELISEIWTANPIESWSQSGFTHWARAVQRGEVDQLLFKIGCLREEESLQALLCFSEGSYRWVYLNEAHSARIIASDPSLAGKSSLSYKEKIFDEVLDQLRKQDLNARLSEVPVVLYLSSPGLLSQLEDDGYRVSESKGVVRFP